jgi:hypothetical protein
MHTRLRKELFRHSIVNRGDLQTHRQHEDRIILLLFLKNKKSRLKESNVEKKEKGIRETREKRGNGKIPRERKGN